MGTKQRNVLKKDAVPTIFCFTTEKKRRDTSIQCAEIQAKKTFVGEALREPECQSISCELIETPKKRYRDAAVGAEVEMISLKELIITSSQRREEHRNPLYCVNPPECSVPKQILKIKLPAKTSKTKSTNTKVSFLPFAKVNFYIESTIEIDSEFDGEDDTNDPAFEPDHSNLHFNQSSDTQDESDYSDVFEESSQTPVTEPKFIVFWTCLLSLFRFCFICFKPTKLTSECTKRKCIVCADGMQGKTYL